MYSGSESRRESEIVIELEVVKGNDDKWYRKGLGMKGEFIWEECVDEEEVYGDNWIDEVVKEVKGG